MARRVSWVLAKTLIFTIVAPGTVTGLIPYLLLAPGAEFEIDRFKLFGLLPIALGAAAYFWCAWDFAMAGRGTPFPLDAPRVFVARGLYRYVRNPMYVAVVSIILGEALVFESWRLFVYALIAWTISHLFVVLYEEPTLRRKFGPQYEEYRRSVPRWIPKAGR